MTQQTHEKQGTAEFLHLVPSDRKIAIVTVYSEGDYQGEYLIESAQLSEEEFLNSEPFTVLFAPGSQRVRRG